MKNLFNLSMSLVLLIVLFGCNNGHNKTLTSNEIIGKWKNTHEPNSGIEFKNNGQYFIWINGECVTDSIHTGGNGFKYSFDSIAKDYNIKIYVNEFPEYGKLELIDQSKMKFTHFNKDFKQIGVTEFAKVTTFPKTTTK